MAEENENGDQRHNQRYHGSARGGRTSGGTRGGGPPNYPPPQGPPNYPPPQGPPNYPPPQFSQPLLPTPLRGPQFSNNGLQIGRGNVIPSRFAGPMIPPRHIPPFATRWQQNLGNFQYTQANMHGCYNDPSIRSSKMNRRFGSMDNLSGNRGRGECLGPRGGRYGNRGHHGSMTDISNTDSNPSRSPSDRRDRGRDRGRHGGLYEDGINSNKGDEESDSDSDGDKTDSISGSEASRSIFSGSQDLSMEGIHDFEKMKPRRKKSPRSKSLNEEIKPYEDDRVDENQIFSYLVKSCGGFITFDDFVRECDLIPTDLDVHKWFRCHRRRFKLFEKKGKILYISAFYLDATICFYYNRVFGRMKSCSKADCEHFHICKEYISGNCSFSESCRFSHSFRDANNLEHKKKLGLLEFSDKEMVIILGNRYPRVCSEFLKTTSCSLGEDCPELHICSLSLRGKCKKSANECSLGHSFETDHNLWVLKALGYYTWLTGPKQLLLKKVILFIRSLEAASDETTEEALDENIADEIAALKKGTEIKKPISRSNRFESRDPDEDDTGVSFSMNQVPIRDRGSSVEAEAMEEPPEGQKKSKSSKKKTKRKSKPSKPEVKVEAPKAWLDDAGSDIPLCSKFLESNCPGVCPRGHHHYTTDVGLAPYIWQIKHDDILSFQLKVNEEIEKGFCKNLEVIDAEILIEDHATYMVNVCVSDARDMRGVVYELDGILLDDPHSLPVRRLSTQSYVEVKDKNLAFTTQWRWFWKDDTNRWQLFEPNNFQITLERKYKYGQTTYLFTREDYFFKYRIDFRTFRQVNLDTRKTRNICRRPLFVSMEDVKNKKFPDCLDVVDPINKPTNFVPWDLYHRFELVELDRVTPEFKTLREKFYETLDNTHFGILYIYRVQNWKLYQDYEVRKRNMKKELQLDGQSHEVNEKFLFHGTDTMDTCRGICTNNFDFRTSGKNATLYGQGSYFAETSKYSNNYTRPGKNQERYMFQAKVLVGQYTKGQSSYKRPPERPGQTHMLYDSCVDNEANPSMYIIFERSQAYPEYLIEYREKNTSGFETEFTRARPANSNTTRVGVVTTTPATTVTPSAKPILPPKSPAVQALKQTPYRQPVPVSPVSVAQAPDQPIAYPTASSVEASAYPTLLSSDRLQLPTTAYADRHRKIQNLSEEDKSSSPRESSRSQDELLQQRTSLNDRLQHRTNSYTDIQRRSEYISEVVRGFTPRKSRRSQDELLQPRTSLSEVSSQAKQPEVSVISQLQQKKRDL